MSVRTTMLILVLNEFPTFTITRLSITLLIFQNVVERSKPFPKAKIQNFYETPYTERAKVSWYGNLCTSAPSLAALGIAGTSSALLSLAQTV